MDPRIFRAALRASARVALTATLASCGGLIRSTPEGDGPGDASPAIDANGAPLADVSQGDAVDLAAPPRVCDPPPPMALLPVAGGSGLFPDAGVSEALFDCCVGVLAAEVADAGPHFSEPATNDPEVLGCCAVAVAELESSYRPPGGSANVQAALQDAGLDIYTCCSALNFHGGYACAPWGPPMPPAVTHIA
jgi:hypothetical protein